MKYFSLLSFLFIVFLIGCVPKSDFDNLRKENEILKDSLIIYNQEIDDLKFGANTLLIKAKNQLQKELFGKSQETLKELINRHSNSNEAKEAEKLLNVIDLRLNSMMDSVNWEKYSLDNTIEGYTQYISHFPKGKYINKAKISLKKRIVESEKIDWETALKSGTSKLFRTFIKNYPKSNKIKIANKKLIDAEVKEIMSSTYGEMPPSTLISSSGGAYAIINIENSTNYTLTVRYSGNDSKSISIASNSNGSMKIKKGYYQVAASVNASNVTNYAGTVNLQGGRYSSNYYISTSSSSRWNN